MFSYPVLTLVDIVLITARKRSLGQGNIFTPVCHSVHRWGMHGCQGGVHGCWEGACVVAAGRCVVAAGGVHGCLGACVVAWGVHGCQGACVVARGHAWLLLGGICGCWGVHGCWGACVVAPRGACMGYSKIRRYNQ